MIRHPKLNWAKVGRIAVMRREGKTYREIAVVLGISFQRVHQLMRWYGQEYVDRQLEEAARETKNG